MKKENRERQEPWVTPIIENMRDMEPVETPNGIALDKGAGGTGEWTFKYGEYVQTPTWDGNRTGE
jgi:hypothetical protein